jgi:hypothetical protein
MLDAAKAGGQKFKTSDVASRARELLRSKAIPTGERDRIARKLVEFASDQGRTIDPVLLKEIKQYYQTRASYAARGSKATTALFSNRMALGAREQLERIPGVGAQEARTQRLIGADRALTAASARHGPHLDLLKPTTYPGISAINSPHVMSRVALTLNSHLFRSLLRQSPRAAAALIMEATQAEPDATSQP